MVVDGIERGGGMGLGFRQCVNQAKVVAMTSVVVADRWWRQWRWVATVVVASGW